MRILPLTADYYQNKNINTTTNIPKLHPTVNSELILPTVSKVKQNSLTAADVSFTGFNPIKELGDFIRYKRARKYADGLYEYVTKETGKDSFIFRFCNLEP